MYQSGASLLLTGSTTIQAGLASDLLNALGMSTTPVSETISNGNNNQSSVTVTTQPGQQNLGTSTGGLGLTGNVRLTPGATVFANLREGASEIAGFVGGNTFGGEGSQSALSRVCSSRPWAGGGFVARIAPDSFFDGLCRAAGYQVGQVQPATGGVRPSASFNTGTPAPVATSTSSYIPPEADIRAEPSSVRLGTRTYIFWTTRGVSSCAVRGPNFEQFTLSGAGATVPITGPTTFTINCVATDNASTTVSDSVTVRLAI